MKARSTFDGKTAEEIEASGESTLDYIARRIEESGGVVELTDRAADMQIIRRVVLKGVRITNVEIGAWPYPPHDEIKVEFVRIPVIRDERSPIAKALDEAGFPKLHQHGTQRELVVGFRDPENCELCRPMTTRVTAEVLHYKDVKYISVGIGPPGTPIQSKQVKT